jgi:phosphoribosylglycinamide formyltransferase 1
MIGVLVSGTGTNLQALIDAGLPIAAVASNRGDAPALERADAAGIPNRVFELERYADREARDRELAEWLQLRGVELVVLAGYMHLLTSAFLDRFPERIVNVHPSLLPAFPGIRAIEQALDYGVKVFGVTVHFVEPGEVDSGAIILQGAVEAPGATEPAEVLAALRPLEHRLLPEAVALIASGAVRRDAGHPRRVILGGG